MKLKKIGGNITIKINQTMLQAYFSVSYCMDVRLVGSHKTPIFWEHRTPLLISLQDQAQQIIDQPKLNLPAAAVFLFFIFVFYKNIFSIWKFTVIYPGRPAAGRPAGR